LNTYKKLIEENIKQQTIIIETSEKIQSKNLITKSFIAKTKAKNVLFKENPEMIFGVKMYHGDWVYENTLNTKLENILETK
jgi:hypothetical protein